jgi:hypothetical protein
MARIEENTLVKQRRPDITADDLNQVMPPVLDDDAQVTLHSGEYVQATHNTVGPGMADVLAAAGTGASVFNQDAAVLEYYSQGVVEPQNIAYTEQRANEMRGLAEVTAALQSSGVQKYADPQYKEQLKHIAAKSANLPAPDTVVHADNQRIILNPQVLQVPAAFNTERKREEALEVLETMIGYEATIEVCACARTAGVCFVALPLLWLSQQLAIESAKNETYEDIPRDMPYLEGVDDKMTHTIPEAISKLFSNATATHIQRLARIHRVPMIYVLRYLVDKICKGRRAVVTPEASSGTKYNDLVPKIKGAA